MILCPSSFTEVPSLVAGAAARGEKISSFDLRALNRVLDHTAEDMTATAQAGVSLAELQKQLAVRGQWLPVDPPGPEQLSLGALLAADASGPRRFGCGTVRDYLIGIKVVLADGRLIYSGGKVVKNVAGYDLGKLFIGSRGSLGVIVEAVFKLCPLPEAESFVEAGFTSVKEADKCREAILDSELTPVVVDLRQWPSATDRFSLVLGFAGTREEVQWQLDLAARLGLGEPASLQYQEQFWNAGSEPVRKLSVLPSKLSETVAGLHAPFVARAGNGIVYYRGEPVAQQHEPPFKLAQRLKQTFDPHNLLPEMPP